MKPLLIKSILLTVLSVCLMSFSKSNYAGLERVRAGTSGDSIILNREQLWKYCGAYLPTGNDPRMTEMAVVMRDGILYRHVNADYVALNPVAENKFIYDDGSKRSLEFVLDKKGIVKEVIVARPDGEFRLTKDPSVPPVELTNFKYGLHEQISMLMKTYSDYGQFNGTVLVSRNGDVIYREAFGKANMELNVANQVDTKYRLASVSKQFTAMLIMQLVDQRKISLQVPIIYYLSDYPAEQGKKITIHHLLSHSSGIPNFTSFPNYPAKIMTKHHTPEELVQEFAYLPLEFEPGTKFSYSNSGYALLGYIIEKITGKSYEQCLQENIFTPLNMKNSGYDHSESILYKRAAGYEKVGNGYRNADYIDMSVPYAAGALYSTAEDLLLWDQGLRMYKILHPASQDLIFKNYFENTGGNYGYGWGVRPFKSIREKKDRTITEHSGGINGFNSFISRVPEDNLLIVLLSNATGGPLGDISYALRAIYYEQPYDMPKRSFAYTLANRIKADGIGPAMAQVAEMKKSGQYKMSEDEINELGYNLLNKKKYLEAIEVFKINVRAFPFSGNCYDSLGEAYMKQGDKKLAIENYKKSIELDPKNENGKKILAELLK